MIPWIQDSPSRGCATGGCSSNLPMVGDDCRRDPRAMADTSRQMHPTLLHPPVAHEGGHSRRCMTPIGGGRLVTGSILSECTPKLGASSRCSVELMGLLPLGVYTHSISGKADWLACDLNHEIISPAISLPAATRMRIFDAMSACVPCTMVVVDCRPGPWPTDGKCAPSRVGHESW